MKSLNVHVPLGSDAVTFAAPGIRIASQFCPPRYRPQAPPTWRHQGRSQARQVLGGHEGEMTADLMAGPGVTLTREVWVQNGAPGAAVRVRLRNTSAEPLRLDALVPLRCEGPDSLLVSGRTAGDWEVLAQARYKNAVPTSVRPGCFDADYAEAVRLMGELGDAARDDGGEPPAFEMDCFGLIRAQDDEGGPVLLMGFLSQLGHLARFVLRTDASRAALDFLEAECEFDGCVVPPGGERTSQWALMMVGPDPHALVADFADRVGRYHGVAPPAGRAPSVWCSWQFYGPDFAEADLAENLDDAARPRMPFDVALIDECWDMSWGDWQGNAGWPSGMKAAADAMRAAGRTPGIWTCPFLARTTSKLAAERPEWLLRLDDGSRQVFKMDGENNVLDPTFPGVTDFIEALYRRLARDWGFTYHKLDFLRSVIMDRRVRFHDPTATRLEAYRRGLEAVRRGLGPEPFLSVCGGHYGGSLGLADSQRSGSDVASLWTEERPALPKLKQNILRTWMNRLWHVDPDAMVVRRRAEPISDARHGFLSLGLLTDDEARTIAVNQYVGGGLVCFSEKLPELHDDRRVLYRHVIPSIASPGLPVDLFAPGCPSIVLTRVKPVCDDLAPWVTVAVLNWEDEPMQRELHLTDAIAGCLRADRLLAYEFFGQRDLGLGSPGDALPLGEIPAHGCRLVRLAPWNGRDAVLAGTDLHFSGGGVEIAAWHATGSAVEGRLATPWDGPVSVAVAFAEGDAYTLRRASVSPDHPDFHMEQP